MEKKKVSCLSILACVWMGLFPLAQGGTYQFITRDKWYIMVALTGLTLLGLIIDLIRKTAKISISVPAVLAALFLLCVGVSCAMSKEDSSVWLMGVSVRREGLISQLCYLTLFFCFLFGSTHRAALAWSTVVGVAGFFAVVLLQRMGHNPLGLYPLGRSYATTPEFQGTIGNVDMCTGYLAMISGWMLCEIAHLLTEPKRRRRRRARTKPPVPRLIALTLGLGMSIYLIITMEVQFGLIALAACLVYLAYEYLPSRIFLPLIIVLVLGVLVMVWYWPGTEGGLWELHEIIHGRLQLSFGSNRLAVWKYSLKLIREQPLPGGGSDTFELRFNQYLRENQLSIPTAQGDTLLPDYFDTPHNEYIAQMVNHGVVAAALLVCLILLSLIRSKRNRNSAGGAIAAYAAQAFFSFSIAMVSPFFWVLLGISFQRKQEAQASPLQEGQRDIIDGQQGQDPHPTGPEGGIPPFDRDSAPQVRAEQDQQGCQQGEEIPALGRIL